MNPVLDKAVFREAVPSHEPPELEIEEANLRILQDRIERIREEKQRLERIQELKELEEQTKRYFRCSEENSWSLRAETLDCEPEKLG
jgi:TolA-binding protein